MHTNPAQMIGYFGYGSNMDAGALRAKGVVPVASTAASLPGYALRFDVAHFFRHEGGMANVVPTEAPGARVPGVLHRLDPAALAPLDRLEARGVGYDRIRVTVETAAGPAAAWAYTGLPAYVEEGLLPTRRYIAILARGARAAGLDPAHLDWLERHPILPAPPWRPFAPAARPPRRDLGPGRTVLHGHLFDMSQARPAHSIAREWFGGRDVTLFLLRRMDSSDGAETPEQLRAGRLSPAQRRYLDAYLHAFAEEYDHLGPFDPGALPEGALLA